MPARFVAEWREAGGAAVVVDGNYDVELGEGGGTAAIAGGVASEGGGLAEVLGFFGGVLALDVEGVGGGDGVGFGNFDDGGKVAEGVVGADVFDLGELPGGGLVLAGEVGGGDLKAAEKDGTELPVDLTVGEAVEDVVDGEMEGGSVVDAGHDEHAGAVGDGFSFAGAAVVVAEFEAAQSGRAAAVSVGEDVTAEVAAFGVDGGFVGGAGVDVRHGKYLLYLGPKVLRLKELGVGDFDGWG
jgi:hypothetical protein